MTLIDKYVLTVVGGRGEREVFKSQNKLRGIINQRSGILHVQEQNNDHVWENIGEFRDGEYWRVDKESSILEDKIMRLEK